MNPGKNGSKEEAKAFLEKEFGAKESIKELQLIRRENGRGVVIIEMEKWEEKEKIMKEKSKLYGRNSSTTREVQRRLKERARKEREGGKKVKVEYRKMYIESELYVWNEEGEEIRKRKNF